MPAYQPDMRRAYATAALTGVAPFQGAAEDKSRKTNTTPPPADPLDELYASGVLPGKPASIPQLAPPPVPMGRGLPSISPDEATKALAQMNAARPIYGAGSFGAILQSNDPVIGAGINIRDNPAEQLAKMQLSAERASGEAAAANAAEQNGLQAQALGQQQASSFAQQQLAQQNLGLAQKEFGLNQQKLAQMAQQFNQQQETERAKITSNENIEKGKYGQPAMQAAANAALFRAIADNIGKPGGPRNAAEAKRMMDAIAAGAQPGAATPGATTPGSTTPAPEQPPPLDQLMDQVRGALTAPPNAAIGVDNINKVLDAIAGTKLPPQAQAQFYDRLFNEGMIPDQNAFGDLLLRSAAKNTVTGPLLGEQGGIAPQYSPAAIPGFTLKSAQNPVVGAWRSLLAGFDDTGAYRTAEYNGRPVTLNVGDVSQPTFLTPGSPEHQRVQQRLPILSQLLAERNRRGYR